MMQTIGIAIEAGAEGMPALTKRMFGAENIFKSGVRTAQIAEHCTIVFDGLELARSHGIPAVLHVLLRVREDVGTGVIAAWLYDKLKGGGSRVTIEATEVELDQAAITQAIGRESNLGD